MAWYRGFIQGKTRIVMAWVFAFFLGLSAKTYPHGAGVVVCFLGATLRYWASGYLRKDSRPAVGGPYAWVRNPLYVGSYLMAAGITAAVEAWVLLGVMTVLYGAVYHFIVLDEELKLESLFGQPYREYRQWVARFVPYPWIPLSSQCSAALAGINPERAHHRFDRKLAAKNKAYEAYLSFVALVGFACLCAWAWKLIEG